MNPIEGLICILSLIVMLFIATIAKHNTAKSSAILAILILFSFAVPEEFLAVYLLITVLIQAKLTL